MLVSIPPYLSVAQFMGFPKGKSSLMIFDRYANLKYKYGSRNFGCRGYYADTVGRNKKIIAEYIRNQMKEDYAADQMSIKEYVDQFTGGYDCFFPGSSLKTAAPRISTAPSAMSGVMGSCSNSAESSTATAGSI